MCDGVRGAWHPGDAHMGWMLWPVLVLSASSAQHYPPPPHPAPDRRPSPPLPPAMPPCRPGPWRPDGLKPDRGGQGQPGV